MRWWISGLTLLLLLLQLQLWFGPGGLLTLDRINSEVDAQRVENAQLQERNAALAAEVQDLKTGLDSIEERARSDMGMIKSNETFYQIIKRD